jgi:hypothetical protein
MGEIASRKVPTTAVQPDPSLLLAAPSGRIRFAIHEPSFEAGEGMAIDMSGRRRLGLPRKPEDKLVAIIEGPATCVPYFSEGRHVRMMIEASDCAHAASRILTLPEIVACASRREHALVLVWPDGSLIH